MASSTFTAIGFQAPALTGRLLDMSPVKLMTTPGVLLMMLRHESDELLATGAVQSDDDHVARVKSICRRGYFSSCRLPNFARPSSYAWLGRRCRSCFWLCRLLNFPCSSIPNRFCAMAMAQFAPESDTSKCSIGLCCHRFCHLPIFLAHSGTFNLGVLEVAHPE